MKKLGQTKKEIIELLSMKNFTLTDLSLILGIKKPSIHQHLVDLKNSGIIVPLENEFYKSLKYYTSVKKEGG